MKLQYYYVADYSLDLCLEYMKHDNVYDRFSYKWEEKEDYYLITFFTANAICIYQGYRSVLENKARSKETECLKSDGIYIK